MKNIEDEYKFIKAEYGDKISTQNRAKLEKCINLVKQMGKCQVTKSLAQERSYDERVTTSIKNQLLKIRKQIQGQVKLQYSDYQAFIWKSEKIVHKDLPNFFSFLKIPKQLLPSPLPCLQLKTNFNMNILSCKISDLIKLGSDFLIQNKFCTQNYNAQMFPKLLTQISNTYYILPYHNFTHAFSVFMMLVQCRNSCSILAKMYSQFQFFIAYISALCHDLNHNGTNSMLEIKKNSDLAVMYNNQSVLQNMHISQFYRLCKENPDIDVIAKMKSPSQRQSAKRLLSKLILSTDIQGHTKNLKKLQSLMNSIPKKDLTNQLIYSQKQLILQNLFHACDIGNPCLDFDIYMNWSLLLTHEFNTQIEIQTVLGLQKSVNMQFVDITTHYTRQIGFIDFLVLPIWRQITNIFPDLQKLKNQVQKNRQKLQELVKQAK